MGEYHVAMATMLRLADWFDYMRENGVYDNTKIILVADHGYNLGQLPNMIMDMGNGETEDCTFYYPLLMVKDYGATGFEISEEFMTNADVPTLATDGAIENPVNPFTGKPINNAEKYAHDQLVIVSRQWSSDVNNGDTYIADKWASVHTDIRNPENWSFYTGSTVLKEHVLPQ
jgi:arylsulfatase A-like enzyme